MNNKKVLLGLVLAFIVLLGGASVLYTRLGATVAPNQLTAQSTAGESAKNTASDASDNADDVSAAETGSASSADSNSGDGANNSANDSAQENAEAARSLVPDFTVYDVDGNEVHLSDFFGKPIVLNFWASWCGPCKMEMPDFHEKYLELGDEVQFLMVNMTSGRETLESAKEFIAESGYTFPFFFDTAGIAAYTYSAYTLPTTYFIDADGHGTAYAQGAINGETLQIGLDMILDD